jgi:endonuclease/exonuclease/phosphatase family metal-dependent hydrolase
LAEKLAPAGPFGEDRSVPVFPKPTIPYDYDLDRELAALRDYPYQPDRGDRKIPDRTPRRLLLATWNIANLGLQQRRDKDYRLLAEVLSWFDLVALEEVNNDLSGLRALQANLPHRYRVLFNDPGGNDERFAFLFDTDKISVMEEVGELTVPAVDLPSVRLREIPARFVGFDRNPMLVSFGIKDTVLLLAAVHLYFGKDRGRGLPNDEDDATSTSPRARAAAVRRKEPPPAAGMDRRVLEAYAIARWADAQHRDKDAYTTNVVALGDFNLPVRAPGDRVYDALTRRGLQLPEHSTHVGGSNLNDDAHFDQMAVFPGPVEDAIEQLGIFDFDGAVFRELWGRGTKAEATRFRSYVKYYLSDHRPLWMALRV